MKGRKLGAGLRWVKRKVGIFPSLVHRHLGARLFFTQAPQLFAICLPSEIGAGEWPAVVASKDASCGEVIGCSLMVFRVTRKCGNEADRKTRGTAPSCGAPSHEQFFHGAQ